MRRAARLITDADGLVISAGARMALIPACPISRGNAGYAPIRPSLGRASPEEIACPDASDHAHPRLGLHRLNLYRRTAPHPGFAILQAIGE